MKKKPFFGRGGAQFVAAQGLLLSVIFSANAAHSPDVTRNSTPMTEADLRADITVKGSVKDAKNEPLPGATITILGTTRGTVTDIDGKFTLSAPENGTLVFSYLGFKSQSVEVNSRSVIEVILEEETASLNEFVVTSFGMAREQKSLGYATTTIKADELIKAGTPNVATALYGKAPGVRIQAGAGGATSAVNISIRGINSITGRNQPLIILDGVPIRN